MLVNKPTAAAPKAWTTSIVSSIASRLRLGASSTPASAANVVPTIHDTRRTAAGLVPPLSSNSAVVDDSPHRQAERPGSEEREQ